MLSVTTEPIAKSQRPCILCASSEPPSTHLRSITPNHDHNTRCVAGCSPPPLHPPPLHHRGTQDQSQADGEQRPQTQSHCQTVQRLASADLRMVQSMSTPIYELRDRVFVGSSIGYYKFITVETFSDRDLAFEELSNYKRSSASYDPFIVETHT